MSSKSLKINGYSQATILAALKGVIMSEQNSASQPLVNGDDFERVMALVNDYFHGLHFGDTQKLNSIFHPDAFLKAPGLRRSLQEWLSAVDNRPIPNDTGEPLLALSLSRTQLISCSKIWTSRHFSFAASMPLLPDIISMLNHFFSFCSEFS